MKKFSKILSVALLVALVLSLGIANAFAASITINRDDSFDGEDGEAGRVYNYYKVFSASYATTGDDAFDGTEFEGGFTADGTPVTEQGEGIVSYTATAAVAAKLALAGNLWFDVADIAGSTNKAVSWKTNVTANAENVQAAAAWLIANGAYEEGPKTLTFADGAWTSGEIDPGYYVVASDSGNNLVAATTDIEIKEKNAFPPHDKTQGDEDVTTQNHDVRDVAIGDVLTYNVTVTVPATAKAGEVIEVWDKASKGLTFNNDLTVTPQGAATAATAQEGDTWRQTITITDALKGKQVVFAFTMTVNDEALVDSDKANESGLKYGNGSDWTYESKPVKVEYKTYFAGIHKVDGSTNAKEDLAGVKFALKENGNAFSVTKAMDGNTDLGYYIPGGTSNEVVTDADGLILIRGLDNDKTYTLTETETLPGFNKLTEDITLTLYEDTYTAEITDEEGNTTTESSSSFDPTKTNDKWREVENNKGTVLPSTGGIGTTIFYVVGGVLVLAAIILLVTKKRMSE